MLCNVRTISNGTHIGCFSISAKTSLGKKARRLVCDQPACFAIPFTRRDVDAVRSSAGRQNSTVRCAAVWRTLVGEARSLDGILTRSIRWTGTPQEQSKDEPKQRDTTSHREGPLQPTRERRLLHQGVPGIGDAA